MSILNNTTSPQEFFGAVHTGLLRCNATQFADHEAVDTVAVTLDRWLSDYPDQAKDIEMLAISACYTATMWQQHATAAKLGAAGLDASLIRPKTGYEDRASAILLSLLTAEAYLREEYLRDAQILLDDATHSLKDLESVGPLAPYLVQRLERLAGAFEEAALENAAAAPHFIRALETGEPLLRNRIRLRSLARLWVPMVFGTGPQLVENGDEQSMKLLRKDILETYRLAALGFARTSNDPLNASKRAIEAIIEFGLPTSVSTLEIRPALLALPAAEFENYSDALIEVADAMESDRRRAVWRATIRICFGRVQMRCGNRDAMIGLLEKSSEDLLAGSDAMTWTGALGDMLSASEPEESGVLAFLRVYKQVATGDPSAPLPLPLRVQFDDVLGSACRWAFDELRQTRSSSASRALSLLLDALRSPDVEELGFVFQGAASDHTLPKQLAQSYEMSLDRIGRLQYAMAQLSRSCSVLMQTVGDQVLFFVATGDQEAPQVLASAGVDYLDAARALARGLAQAIEDPKLDTTDRIAKLGKSAFNALPVELQDLLRKRKQIYIVPDFWSDRENIPFELLHDGRNFLCLSKIITRSLSLRELLRAVEPPVIGRSFSRRAVCLAAPVAEGLPALLFASPEVEDVRFALEESGWDAPETGTASLGPSRLLDAMELAGITHIAAHGKVHAGGEALVLPDGSTLTVEDIEERPRRFGGLIFLNACSLGRARYLGGGITRGIASAFVRAGAPCAIANLLPVEDRSASVLAAGFYRAAKRYNVGEALRLSRKALADQGIPPSRWGTTILLGKPQFRITARSIRLVAPKEPAAELLYRYTVPDETVDDAPVSIINALEFIDEAPQHVRLQGALDWVDVASTIAPDGPPETVLAAARVARALDCPSGEALYLFAATKTIEDEAQLRGTLDQAIRALEPLAPLNNAWYNMHVEALACRQKLDARHEIPFIDGVLRVNDPDDPATQAVLRIQHAIDRQHLRKNGPLRLRRPERTLADIAWNAVIIGQQNRFQTEDSQYGFALQMADKLAYLQITEPEVTTELRRALAGTLAFLWGSQRITHLEPELAMGQSETLRLIIESFSVGWDAQMSALLQPLIAITEGLGAGPSSSGSKFLQALDALQSKAPVENPKRLVETRIREALDSCSRISPKALAEAAVWSTGLLLEQAYEARRAEPSRESTRKRLLHLYQSLSSNIEEWLFPYLMDGFEKVRGKDYDFVQQWEWDTPKSRKKKS